LQSVPTATASEGAQAKSWRDALPVHPAAELFPPMGPAELRELGEDIRKNDLQVPITVLHMGTISFADRNDRTKYALLDGRNRLDAMELVGIRFKLVWVKRRRDIGNWQISSDEVTLPNVPVDNLLGCDDPYALVASLNAHRRHLTGEQKRDLIAALLKATPEKSNRQIAATVKADDKTVGSMRRRLEATAEIPQLPKTVGKDRKARPTKWKRPPTDQRAAVPKPLPAETAVREAVAPDEELDLLREFARFVIDRARVSTDHKDQIEWRVLRDRVKQVLHPPEACEMPAFLRRPFPGERP
jgi:hypothetical protein